MNWAIIFCTFASAMYAFEIVLSERLTKGIPASFLTMCLGFGVGICAVPFVLNAYTAEDAKLPHAKEWILLAVIVCLSFLADWSHFSALKQKAGAAGLATYYVLIPVACTVIKGEFPSLKMLGAWILGGAALFLISDELKE